MSGTRVGYAGGKSATPTYTRMGDHTESIEITYDPARVSYAQLLEKFWSSHDPTHGSGSRQYRALALTSGGTQDRLARETREQLAAREGRAVQTEVAPLQAFYPAEDYHQKYYLRRDADLWRAVRALFPDENAALQSTLAARLNGWLGGHGSLADVEQALAGLAAPADARERVLALARRNRR